MVGNEEIGFLIEGVVELDPMTGLDRIRVVGDDGKASYIDPQTLLRAYRGQEVRLTLASFEALERVARMLEQANE